MIKLNIATYNIHKGFSRFNRRMVMHELRDRLRELNADIVFLQEVQGENIRNVQRHKHYPVIPHHEFLAGQIWPYHAYGKNAVYTNGHHGNAVLSRYPISQWENLDISTHRFESRGLLHCEIDLSAADGLESVDNHATGANGGNRDAVQGARDAVWSFQTRSEQRRNTPDSPVSGGLPPDGVPAALSGLPRERPLAAPSALHSSPSGEQRISPDNCQQPLTKPALLHCFCVHLGLFKKGRKQQFGAIVARIKKVVPPDSPLIIAGDFNDWNNNASRLLEQELQLYEAFEVSQGKPALSYPVEMPMLRLDRIYVRGLSIHSAQIHAHYPWNKISDHAALSATLLV